MQFTLPMIFTLIIGLLASAELFYWEMNYTQFELWEIPTFFSSFAVLMLLDLVDILVFPRKMPYAIKVILFFLRIGIIALLQYIDVTGAALSLIALVPYYTFFTLGGVVSVIFSLMLLTYFYTQLEVIGPEITLAVVNLIFMQILSFVTYHAHQVALRNRELLEELHHKNTELELVADEVAEFSAMEERMRLSRDLHDSVGHHLTAISIQLEKAVAYQEISEDDSIESVINARKSAGEALQDVRNFVGSLKDKQVAFSFKDRVEALVQGMDQDQLVIEYDISGDEELYLQPIRRSLFYALQELITNIQKHAEATDVKIKVKFTKRETTMVVEDNGVGFAPQRAIRKDGHFGLKHLTERITLLNGILNIKSKKGKGTVVNIHVPRER